MPAPYYTDDTTALHLGDCLDILPTLPDNSIDAIVCDPPYGLANLHPDIVLRALTAWIGGDRTYTPTGKGFMGKEWDAFVPPPAVWDQCLRVLKPGGHLVAFAGTRTMDLMTLSIRLAGFEIRDSLTWMYGGGFPKGQNIGKSIDRHRDDRAQVLQITAWLAEQARLLGWDRARLNAIFGFHVRGQATHWVTQGVAACVPTVPQWNQLREALGFDDTTIKPLVEELNRRKGSRGEAWAQRELIGSRHDGKTSAFLSGSTGRSEDGSIPITAPASDAARQWNGWNTQLKPGHEPIVLARKSTGFDSTVANVLLHGTGALNIDGCRVEAGQDYQDKCASVVGIASPRHGDTGGERFGIREDSAHEAGRWPSNVLLSHSALLDPTGQPVGDACADGCVPGCPVTTLEQQSAGAPRFFHAFRYEAKAPASERPRLPDGTAHPTVKPLALMRWLVRLITPPCGTVLDWCAGSGTTLEAAAIEGFPSIGIEREPSSADLCVTRLSKPLAAVLFGDTA